MRLGSPVSVAIALALASLATTSCGGRSDDGCQNVSICEPGAQCFEAECNVAERCRFGLEARYYGRDTPSDGGCIAAVEAACENSEVACRVWGQCGLPGADFTRPGTCPDQAVDRDFLASNNPSCAGIGTCIARDDADCAQSDVCRVNGRCRAQAGICVAVDAADCEASTMCERAGRCTIQGIRCVAATPADCAKSESCQEYGHCAVVRGACKRCESAPVCRAQGLCRAVDGACRATELDHCRASDGCRRSGACRIVGGRCVK